MQDQDNLRENHCELQTSKWKLLGKQTLDRDTTCIQKGQYRKDDEISRDERSSSSSGKSQSVKPEEVMDEILKPVPNSHYIEIFYKENNL